MSIASRAQAYFVDVNRPGNMIRDAWQRLSGLPGGKLVFSKMVGQAAPYTATVGARVVELREGFARVQMADRRKVRNHLNCVHAVALTNLAELTGNIAMAYSLPPDARFIVAGLSIEYLKKARGEITGEASFAVPTSAAKQTYEVPVVLKDRAGTEVARAKLQTLVGPKK
jgi:uncharacterized protein (TIGR00369 family)